MTDLRTRIAAVLEKHAVAQYCWGPEGCICDYKLDISDEDHPRHQADAVIDVLIDLAGHGELLKAIDRMYREPRSAEKLGLTGDGE
jgi:hypothetical protein